MGNEAESSKAKSQSNPESSAELSVSRGAPSLRSEGPETEKDNSYVPTWKRDSPGVADDENATLHQKRSQEPGAVPTFPTGNDATTMQSMVRPDLMQHTFSDPRRFLSIERELSESSAAIKFLEKRLNRLEKDGRITLAVAALAVLLAVVAIVL